MRETPEPATNAVTYTIKGVSPSLLLTAFEPFGEATLNASWEVAKCLAAQDPSITLIEIPVVRGKAENTVLNALAVLPPPKLILSLGEATLRLEDRGIPHIAVEKVAINWDDYRIPDNAGNQPRDLPIIPNAPAAYFATLPVASVVRSLEGKTPIPIRVSLSAGAFLCNHLFYSLLHHGLPCPYTFIHLPAWRPDFTLNFEDLVESTTQILTALRNSVHQNI